MGHFKNHDKDTDDLFTYTGGGGHSPKSGPKHRAEPDGQSHKKGNVKGAHR